MRVVLGHPRCWMVCAASLVVGGCQKQDVTGEPAGRILPQVVSVRDVRVLLVDDRVRCKVRVDGPFEIRNRNGRSLIRLDNSDWNEISAHSASGLRFKERTLGSDVYDLVPTRDGSILLSRYSAGKWGPPRRYSGFLRFTVSSPGRLRVLNHVDLETYVACVLPGEILSNFHTQAYRAQAVAVRTYALFQMAMRAHKEHDVVATEASQVYHGLDSTPAFKRARQAADSTRGIVATWSSPSGERIFCTFYSSCCGGATVDVAACRNDIASIPPLAGGVACNCRRIASRKSYLWGPVRLSKSEMTSKLVSRYPNLKRLGRLERIEVSDRTPQHRPTRLRLIGKSGRSERMIAENFRLAVGSRTIRSTNFKVQTQSGHFEFSGGKGFGHGMGMCQWGMQEMALRGFQAAEILKHYYPTMNLTRSY